MNDIGPKVTGTKENEEIAVNYLKSRVLEIRSKAHRNQNVSMDHQIASGGYLLGRNRYGTVSTYRKVQNVIARLEGDSPNAIMMNCHFDSYPGSPGASDDLSNCAIMLELLSILSLREARNRHSIIFLFNGAEESGLRASHAFITQHKWRHDVKAFINLEAAGAGGKETLFQTVPGSTWLLNYFKNVQNPVAQAVAEEMFQNGFIPSDSDFRIFQDYGHIPGMDFAFTSKGYHYHTKFDSIDFLTQGVLQLAGSNMLSLVESMANSFELDSESTLQENSTMVYFDILGFYFVYYSKEFGVLINLVVSVAAVTVPYLILARATHQEHLRSILKETLLGFAAILVGLVSSALLCVVTAYALDKMGHSMSWYSTTSLAIGIYGTLTLFAHVLANDIVDMRSASMESQISFGKKLQARLNGVNVFWGLITLGITLLGYRAGYLFMVVLLINLVMNIGNYYQNSGENYLTNN